MYAAHQLTALFIRIIGNRAGIYYIHVGHIVKLAFFKTITKPWLAFKVLAAGAIHPRQGFLHAFRNGADFIAVGMFDFQIAENVALTTEVVAGTKNRDRDWYA